MKRLVIFYFTSIIFLISCTKDPGEGGTSTIRGTIYSKNIFDNSAVTSEDAEAKEDVYIEYGDDPVYGNSFKTGFDGKFEFKFLRKGSYTIYAYSLDSANRSSYNKVPVMKNVSIREKNQIAEINSLVIFKEPDDKGNSTIRGKIFVKDYDSDFLFLERKYYGPDEYVYIIYGNDLTYSDRVKTDINGVFEFRNLRKGPYKVYAFSKDLSENSDSKKVIVEAGALITAKNQIIEIPDLVIIE